MPAPPDQLPNACYPTCAEIAAGDSLGDMCAACGHLIALHSYRRPCVGCEAMIKVDEVVTWAQAWSEKWAAAEQREQQQHPVQVVTLEPEPAPAPPPPPQQPEA